MKYYPAFLDLRERPCLVVGGGAVAERKAVSLLDAGADVTVISPALTPKLHDLASVGRISHRNKSFEDRDIDGFFLVIAATDSQEINTGTARLCRKRQVPVNVASPPEESSFIVPSVIERGQLLIAVSTSGVSPALSRKIRQDLQKQFGPEYDVFLQRLTAIRQRVLNEVADDEVRRNIFRMIVDSDVVDLLRQGKTDEAELRMIMIAGLKHRP
jgi:precorrin-2 dehydrogenase / sirohydrochlorin ferrochelatase